MSERFFRLIVGALLLALLYFDASQVLPVLLALLIFEGITNFRIPILVNRLRANGEAHFADSCDMTSDTPKARFNFDAERAWRLVVAAMLAVTFYMFNDQLWFFPWFMGFAIFGAGLSGVCPVLMSLKLIGFR